MTEQADVLRVLVVDDDETSRELVSEVFKEFGHTVVEAVDGPGAIRALQASDSPFDMMVLDIQMPGMDGMEVASWVRHSAGFRELPILAVTALAHPSEAARIIRAGCDAYLSKPVSVIEVRGAARRLLDEGRTRAALHAFADALARRSQRDCDAQGRDAAVSMAERGASDTPGKRARD